MTTPPPLSLGDCLADTNYSSLDLIFARVTTEGGTATPLARATVVRLAAAICTQIIVPSITDPVTKALLTNLPPVAQAGFVGGALQRANYGTLNATPHVALPRHPGRFDFDNVPDSYRT